MNFDPLFVANPKVPCRFCAGERVKRLQCDHCRNSGYTPVNLNGLWSPSPGFLVCGGPSINKVDYQRLRERGIVSMAVNQVAGYVPVTAWCFGDPGSKFHHGIHLDPKCLTFAPVWKLRDQVHVKLPDGHWRNSGLRLRDCPGNFGFARESYFDPQTFFTDWFAHWGGTIKIQQDWDIAHPVEVKAKEKVSRVDPQDRRPDGDHVLCSMLLGIRLLHYLGCPRVYMLGVDFNMPSKKNAYAFGQEKDPRNGRYHDENQMLRELKPIFDAEGFQLFNTNPESKCDVFPHVSFEDALNDCRGAVPKEPFDLALWYNKDIADRDIKANKKCINLDRVIELQRQLNAK